MRIRAVPSLVWEDGRGRRDDGWEAVATAGTELATTADRACNRSGVEQQPGGRSKAGSVPRPARDGRAQVSAP